MFGLALEGGGTRGSAHVGVLRALHEAKLIPSLVSGTSAGSIVAATYALSGDVDDARRALDQAAKYGHALLDLNIRGIVRGALQILTNRSFTLDGVFRGDALLRWMTEATGGTVLSDVKIPLVIPAVDLISGNIVAFASRKPSSARNHYRWMFDASLAQAVRASSAIPVVYRPYAMGDALLVDGGVLENLPSRIQLPLGMRRVLGVVLESDSNSPAPPQNILGIGLRTMQVMQWRLAQQEEDVTTYLLRVQLPKESGLFSFDQMKSNEELGYQATIKALPEIRRAFGGWEVPRYAALSAGARVSDRAKSSVHGFI